MNVYVTSIEFQQRASQQHSPALTDVGKKAVDSALHRQFVQVSIQQREDAFRQLSAVRVISSHDGYTQISVGVSNDEGM